MHKNLSYLPKLNALKQIFPLESKACVYLLYMIFWRDLWQKFVSMIYLCVCLYLLHFVSLLTIYAVAYCHAYIERNKPKLADWSKWIYITFWSSFCSLLSSNWKVGTGRSLKSILIISKITQIFVISSYIEDIETNLPIEKHTLRVFTWYFEEIVGKTLFRCFIYVFVSICCILCHF